MRLLCLLTAWPLIVFGQKPVIFPNGVVNGASYEPANITQEPGKFLQPGSIVSIFGQNLASSTQSATTVPLPNQLASTTVTSNGVAAPLFYVAPGQIDFQMSFNYGPIVVSTMGGVSDPYLFGNSASGGAAFGIFASDASGCGQGAVLNDSIYGTVSVNSTSNAVSPGDY